MQYIFDQVKNTEEFAVTCEKYIEKTPLAQIKLIFLQCLEEENIVLAGKCLNKLGTCDFGNSEGKRGPIGEDRRNPLIAMAFLGKLNSVKFLVECGANVNHLSDNNTTAIMYAFQQGYIDIVQYLHEHGAETTVGKDSMWHYANDIHAKKYINLISYCFRKIENLNPK